MNTNCLKIAPQNATCIVFLHLLMGRSTKPYLDGLAYKYMQQIVYVDLSNRLFDFS